MEYYSFVPSTVSNGDVAYLRGCYFLKLLYMYMYMIESFAERSNFLLTNFNLCPLVSSETKGLNEQNDVTCSIFEIHLQSILTI
jgi:hypothetical protein